ncbi:MAG: hypothetical protein NTV49_01270, partial [Kiritimatiellaeota bacterium]|nr:hypothetical protein [Kiritimatiellota bacterium]
AVGGARLRLSSFGATILLVDALAGALLMPLGAIDATWQGALLLLLVGVLSGTRRQEPLPKYRRGPGRPRPAEMPRQPRLHHGEDRFSPQPEDGRPVPG